MFGFTCCSYLAVLSHVKCAFESPLVEADIRDRTKQKASDRDCMSDKQLKLGKKGSVYMHAYIYIHIIT